ncbi:thiopeptide-type bacteriocin biosynthesis protein [Kibdelosporangium banguiense]|uniref:Thiopeptide-type bacteriocin biosynthesis protein n=1 Tax=Kibdelosporangium banguiense TaxID=1365924 RepID=A0ABS4TJS9_9PSEU|nr:thiopeptide-type bacteriocin biosynthesis protein [Kibdelosporangium banguiense]MBP2324116.1 thiopeptide-type bacteriocin biosynthesis protein [Kibdelosporangium banguiense]
MTWNSVHCRLSWQSGHVDDFVTGKLAALFEGDWFYVRYWETGPHLRIRYRGKQDLRQSILDLVTATDHPLLDIDPVAYYAEIGAPGGEWLPHGDVREVPYEPEIERYGGPEGLPIAEDLFCRSTEVAVAVLRSTRSKSARLSAAIGLAITTTRALGMDRPAAAAWLRTMGASWRYAQEPATSPSLESHIAAHQILSQRGKEISARWDRPDNPAAAHWSEQIRAARAKADLPPRFWASQLHMLFNRMGVSPEEERMVCWLVAAAALAPDGLSTFHGDDSDQRYLEASKFLPGFINQFPRTASKPPAPAKNWTMALPPPENLTVPLVTALNDRHTSRDEALSGTLTTVELSTLLWTAQGGRPYPSAGAQYCARIRAIALSVEGLTPGCYDFDEICRTLEWTGPCPSVPDLESTSMWFGPGTTELSGTPAVLALYVRIGELRQTYGLRALRFAFTEAGHLAQNLGLTAAAMGLSMGTIGGIYDDLAHDLLALDGVNATLVYLLPVARSESAGSVSDAQ